MTGFGVPSRMCDLEKKEVQTLWGAFVDILIRGGDCVNMEEGV
jgi:hypothetical protein